MSSETPPPYGEPTPPPYGAPAPQQYGAPMPPVPAAPQNGMGTASLVMGILQFFLLGPIGSVLAIVFGRIGINRAKRGEANNGGVAKAGFWLGIVGLILSVVFVVIIVATGAFVFKEVAKSINESTDPAKNSQTGLADGDYQMTPTSATGLNDKCGFEGPAVAAATGETSSGNVLVVGQGQFGGETYCSTSVSVDFTVTGGVATITSISSGGTQTGQAAAPTQDSSAATAPIFSALGDLRGDWTGTGTEGQKATLTVSSPDALNGTIVYACGSESWTQVGIDAGAALVEEKPLPGALDTCTTVKYSVTVDGASLAAKVGDYTMVLTR